MPLDDHAFAAPRLAIDLYRDTGEVYVRRRTPLGTVTRAVER
jgi:hypothetical protein